MNRIFYLMILVAFLVAAFLTLSDPAVPLKPADRETLVETVAAEIEARGQVAPAEMAAFLQRRVTDLGEKRGVDDVVERIEHSGGQGDLGAALTRALGEAGPDLTAEAVVTQLETVGDFTVGETSAIKRFNDGLFSGAKKAILSVIIPLIGAMAFFLGLMKVAEVAGAMKIIAKLLRPLMVTLFPDVPPNHPAMGAMILNMSANALGLGNAATPFGIKAMQELDKLNPEKGTATNAMCLFLAINTSSVTLLPTGVIAIREALGSTNAAGILPTTLAATILSTSTAIIAAKVYQRFSPAPQGTVTPDPAHVATDDDDAYPLWVSLTALAGLLAMVPVTLIYGDAIGPWLVPMIVVGFMTFGAVKGVAVYEAFVEGAKEGWEVAVRIVPYLVAILAAVGMLDGAGAIDLFVNAVGSYTMQLGMPAEALPMALLRPLSGSGANGIMIAIMEDHGADTYIGYIVSTLQGSTETTFYVLAVYFGAVQVNRIRHGMAAALTADAMGIIGAVAAVSAYFTFNGLW